MFIRKTVEPINIGNWAIPKDQFAIAWSTTGPSFSSFYSPHVFRILIFPTGHMNSKVWTDANDTHPVDTYWPGRFLKYPTKAGPPVFSLEGKESSWLPFGSGANLCPGRQFAKIHCAVTLAMMVDSFECDILAGPKALKPDMKKFGMGILGPSSKVAVRLRPRETPA
jgi:cytochrome P450